MGIVSSGDDGIRTIDVPGYAGQGLRWFGSRMTTMKDHRRHSFDPQLLGRLRQMRKSSNCSQDYCGAADPAPATKGSKHSGRRIIRTVARILALAKNARENKKASGLMDPASSASEKLSRTTSTDSSEETDPEGDTAEESAASSSRLRVSFNSEVTVVVVDQMNEEEVRKTFYRRAEYVAFRDAYRVHREASTDWCRSNDVLPCNCEACRDDLAEGDSELPIISGGTTENEVESLGDAGLTALDLQGTSDLDSDDRVSLYSEEQAAGDPQLSPAGFIPQGDWEGVEESEPSQLTITDTAAQWEQEQIERKVTRNNDAEKSDGRLPTKRLSLDRSFGRLRGWGGRSKHRRRIMQSPAHASIGYSYNRRGGSVGRSHSLDDWGVNAHVQEAVRCHGAAYAYSTLRLQGFSDLYIRTNFLPDGRSEAARPDNHQYDYPSGREES